MFIYTNMDFSSFALSIIEASWKVIYIEIASVLMMNRDIVTVWKSDAVWFAKD